jgi:hypothetical protein
MNTEPISQAPSVAHNSAPYEDDEISLLDLLQTVVENLRLLVLGPLAVGVAALGISFTIPPAATAAEFSRCSDSKPGGLGRLGRRCGRHQESG